MNAETAYLFRHAVLRDAAYGLQLPGDRAHLHRLALDILEEVFGEEPPGSMAPDLAGHCAMGAVDTDAGLRDGLGRKEVRYLNLAGEYAGDRYRNTEALTYFERVVAHPQVDDATKADALHYIATIQFHAGRLDEAEAGVRQAAELAEKLGDDRVLASSLQAIALISRRRGAQDTGDLLQRAMQAASRTGKGAVLAVAQRNYATWLSAQGEYDRARELLRESLSLLEKLDMPKLKGLAWGNLGMTWHRQDELAEAESCYRKAAEYYRQAGDRLYEAKSLANTARAAYRLGRLDEAEGLTREALAIQREVGDRWDVVTSLINLAEVLHDLGRGAPAREALDEAVPLATELRRQNELDRAGELRQRMESE